MKAFITKLSQPLIHWSAVALLILTPIVFIPAPWATIAHAKFLLLAAAVAVGVGVFGLARMLTGSWNTPRSWTLGAAFLVPAAYAASALVNHSFAQSLFGYGVERDTLLAACLWVGALMLAAGGFSSRGEILKAVRALVWLSGAVVVFQFIRLLGGASFLTLGGTLTGTAASVVGSWHDLGIFLGFSTLLAGSLAGAASESRRGRLVSYGVIGLCLTALFLINTPDVWMILGIISALLALLGFVQRPAKTAMPEPVATPMVSETMPHVSAMPLTTPSVAAPVPHSSREWLSVTTVVFSGIFIASLIGFFLGGTISGLLPQSMSLSQPEVRPSWQGTFDVAAAVYQSSSGALFGSGPNTFTRQWGLYKPSGVNETAFWNADFTQGIGFIPTTFVTLGIVGAIAWILFIGFFVYEGVRVYLRSRRDSAGAMARGLWAAALYLIVLIGIYPSGPMVLIYVFVTIGLSLAWASLSGFLPTFGSSSGERGMLLRMALMFLGLLVALVAIGSAALFVRSILSDAYVNRSITTFNASTDAAKAQSFIDRALAIQPDNDRAHRAAVDLGLVRLAQLSASTSTDATALRTAQEDAIRNAIAHGTSAVELNPRDYQNWLTLAGIYEQLAGARVEGAYERAEEAYTNASKENPTSPVPYVFLARLALTANDAAKARTHLEQAVTLKSNLAEAHYLLSQLNIAENKLADAQVSAENAVRSAPNEPLTWFNLGTIYYTNKDYRKAAAALEQAVTLNNNYANALYVLALSYDQLGTYDGAVLVLERVLTLNPDNEQVKELLRVAKEKQAEAIVNPQPAATSTPAN